MSKVTSNIKNNNRVVVLLGTQTCVLIKRIKLVKGNIYKEIYIAIKVCDNIIIRMQ